MSKEPVHEESTESQLGWEELNVNEDLALSARSKAWALSLAHHLVSNTIWSGTQSGAKAGWGSWRRESWV